MDPGTSIALLIALLVGAALGLLAGLLLGRSRAGVAEVLALESRAGDAALIQDGLHRLHEQMRELHDHRAGWQGQLRQQVDDMRHSTDLLRRETSSLATALRRPQVRGRWGEMHLRRAVELAGLVARCDFDEQVTLRGPDSPSRPDLVVHLAGGKHVVVDAKVPLDAFLDVTEAEEADEHRAHLTRHSLQFRRHVDALAEKRYWRSLPATPEFVVMFVPGESFLSAALEGDPTLLEYAAERNVILATPTTLIALLRTVAHAWTQEALAERATAIHQLGRELHERLCTMGGHLDKVGRSLGAAVASYNQAVGSLESRVLVTARRFEEMEVSPEELAAPRPVDTVPRSPSAAELVSDARSAVHRQPPSLGVAAGGSA